MRGLADAERLRRFLRELAREADVDAAVYLTGGATAVLLGWRESTIDADILIVPEHDSLYRALPRLKEELQLNVEIASPAHFIPELPGWPDQAKAVQDKLDAAKASLEKGDYAAALASAQDVVGKTKDLASAAAAKKAEMMKSWEDMSAGLPKMVDAIKSRVDILSQAKKLPAGLDKAKLEDAKSGLAAVTQTWQAATDAAKAGNAADAMAKAGTVKAKAVEIMGLLGMQVPAAAK